MDEEPAAQPAAEPSLERILQPPLCPQLVHELDDAQRIGVGEVDELRSAYHMAQARGYTPLPFEVPVSHFDREYEYPAQMIQL